MNFIEQDKYIKNKLKSYTKDELLIQELAQLVHIRTLKKKYDENDNQYKKFLNLIIRSVFIDYYREKKDLQFVWFDDKTISPEDEIINRENRDFVFNCIDKLPENQKEVVILRYYFGFKYSKISKLMNVSKNTALGYMNYAKERLKKFFKK